jgi:hypothetical protein
MTSVFRQHLPRKILLHQLRSNPGTFLRPVSHGNLKIRFKNCLHVTPLHHPIIIAYLKSQLISSQFQPPTLRKLGILHANDATMTPKEPPYSNLQLVERVDECGKRTRSILVRWLTSTQMAVCHERCRKVQDAHVEILLLSHRGVQSTLRLCP